jgi:hypothetical protein
MLLEATDQWTGEIATPAPNREYAGAGHCSVEAAEHLTTLGRAASSAIMALRATDATGPGSVGALLAESQDFDDAFDAESEEDSSDAAPTGTPRDTSKTGKGRNAVPDPLAGLQGGPSEGGSDEEDDELDENPDHDLEVDEHDLMDGDGGAGTLTETVTFEQVTIFNIDSDHQAWTVTTDDGGKTMPVGRPGAYHADAVDRDMARQAKAIRRRWPHPMMTPCTTCAGIMGVGICRQDEQCPLHTAQLLGKCPNCGSDQQQCDRSSCTCKCAPPTTPPRPTGATPRRRQRTWRHPQRG